MRSLRAGPEIHIPGGGYGNELGLARKALAPRNDRVRALPVAALQSRYQRFFRRRAEQIILEGLDPCGETRPAAGERRITTVLSLPRSPGLFANGGNGVRSHPLPAISCRDRLRARCLVRRSSDRRLSDGTAVAFRAARSLMNSLSICLSSLVVEKIGPAISKCRFCVKIVVAAIRRRPLRRPGNRL